MIVMNSATGKFDLMVDGRVVKSSTNKYYLQQQAKLFAVTGVVSQATPVVQKSEFSVTERFSFIEKFVEMLKKKSIASMIITGDGGLGKTFTVINTLKKLGLKEDTVGELDGDFIVIKGFMTAKAMYRSLWNNNGKVIVFDDSDSVFKDPVAANILKAALDSQEKRVISWGSEGMDEDLPSRFEFFGRVIFISNLPQSKFPQALLSRSMRVDLTLTTEEKVDRIKHVFSMIKEDADVKADVLAFVEENAEKFTDLNIRSALALTTIRKDLKGDPMWKRMALYNATAKV
jgi:hypothetical protein